MNPKSSSSADDVLEVRGLSADAATASESAGPDVASPAAAPSAAALTSTEAPAWLPPALVLLLLLGLAALWLGWSGREQTQGLEREIVRRVQTGTEHADEARLLAKQAVEANRETAAKLALLDSRLAEVALQRSQLEELIQQLSRSRDENAVADIDAALRVAVQQ
ncbi:MAG: hypothetical protein RL722_1448, partial [Pseudomonadota bacterium]